jgi:hypothetical protein
VVHACRASRTRACSFGRRPTAEESASGASALGQFKERWSHERVADPAQQALATYCHAIVNSAAFLYID